jgi:hypothetical protein
MVAGKLLGMVKNIAPEQSSWITPRRFEELGGDW